ncbi:hypothetical protein FRC00_002290 [Tulasnella sp. 408]|nr:hypothetical protein FRC00_002290 [Tulasnella sp. 408]
MTDGTHTDSNDDMSLDGASSPAPSINPSLYSYHSSVDGNVLLKDSYGRIMNNVSEHHRLDKQHEMLKQMRNGLFFAVDDVRRALAPREDPESQPAVLDIGSGSGLWMIDMAKMFPHVEIVGIDLAPANLSESPPPNCRFECDDVNLGLLHYTGAFDVVHVSAVAQGIANYRKMLDEITEILRPGGVFLAVDGDVHLWDENQQLIPFRAEGEPARGPGVDDYVHIYDWLQEQGPIWESTGRERIYIQLGPWKEDATTKDKWIGEVMQQNVLWLVDAFRPLLLSYGFFAETVDRWSTNARDEVQNLKHKFYIRWQFEWAVKSREAT